MEPQSFANHARFVKGYHFLLFSLLTVGFIVAAINVYRHIYFEALLSALLILLLFICGFVMAWYLRVFALKAQDRAIRAEESLRFFVLSGKPIDKRITMQQIIALRFAEDDELLPLADKAIAGNMSSKEIKQAIVNWRADHHRA